jgi:hypothetical protein
MIETKVTCDRCGIPIVKDRTRLNIASGPFRKRFQNDGESPGFDVCRRCMEQVIPFLGHELPSVNERAKSLWANVPSRRTTRKKRANDTSQEDLTGTVEGLQ